MSKYCSFCKTNTNHYMKSKTGVTTCPVLLKAYCYRCNGTGHTAKACPKECPKACPTNVVGLEEFPILIPTKEPKTESTQKTWASLAAKAPNPSAAKLIEESNQKLQKQVEETNKKRAAKKHQEWVERQEKRKKREEKQNLIQQEQIQRKIEIAKAEYGHRWYAYVEDTELDCKLAEELRYNEMQQYYDYEYEQIQEEIRMSKLDTLYNRNKKTMSREEFREWLMEWEDEDDFSEYSIQDATRVCIINTPAVTSYYNKTGLILHPDDFVSREQDAPLKPGLLRKNHHLI